MARSNRHSARKPTPAQRVEVRVDDIAAGGDGVATHEGARVFTPLTAPGDLAVIELRGERGTLVTLTEKGPHRIDAPCRHYGRCGGCALQHVSAAFYRDWKRRRVIEALARAGLGERRIEAMIETPVRSRRRAVFAVRKLRKGALVGFNARRSAAIEEVDDCLILHPEIATRLGALRALAALIDAEGFDLSVTRCENGLDLAIVGKTVAEPRGNGLIALLAAMRAAGAVRLSINGASVAMISPPVVSFGGVAVTPPPGGFLQASVEGEAALIGLVREGASGARKIADLFSGCGTFALPLARTASVLAIDSDEPSIDALAKAAASAQKLGLNPLEAQRRDLFERPLTAKELKSFDAIVFDPPRAGGEAQAREIAASGVARVIGVSCNPQTFARDASILRDGGYALERVTPVDQFIYAAHIELVGVFARK